MILEHIMIDEQDLARTLSLIHKNRAVKIHRGGDQIIDEVFHPRPKRVVVTTVPDNRTVLALINPSFPCDGEFQRGDTDAYDVLRRALTVANIEYRTVHLRYL